MSHGFGRAELAPRPNTKNVAFCSRISRRFSDRLHFRREHATWVTVTMSKWRICIAVDAAEKNLKAIWDLCLVNLLHESMKLKKFNGSYRLSPSSFLVPNRHKKAMAKVGWDFGEDFATGPAVVPMSSGWPTTSSQTMPSSEGPVRIGFVFDEVAGSPTPLVSPTETPAGIYMNNNGSMNPDLPNSDDAIAYWTFSSNTSRHTPLLHDRFSGTQESTLSEGPKSSCELHCRYACSQA